MTIHYTSWLNGNDYYDKAQWVTSTLYTQYVSYVKNGTAPNAACYLCTVTHTSSASNEPGVGAQWDSYWDLISDGSWEYPFRKWADASRGLVGGDEIREKKGPSHTAISVALSWTNDSGTVTGSGDLRGEIGSTDLLGKNAAGEAWYEVNTVDYAAGTTTITLFGKYYGTTESVTSYNAGTISVGSLGYTDKLQELNASGSFGNFITISGGWNLATQTQDGETWFLQSGTRGYGFIVGGSYSNIKFSKINGARLNIGFQVDSPANGVEWEIDSCKAVSYNSLCYMGGATYKQTRVYMHDCLCGSMINYGMELIDVYGTSVYGSTIKNCRFDGCGVDESKGIYLYGTRACTLENVVAHNFEYNFYGTLSYGLKFTGTTDFKYPAGTLYRGFLLDECADVNAECNLVCDGTVVWIEESPCFSVTGKLTCTSILLTQGTHYTFNEIELQGTLGIVEHGVFYAAVSDCVIGKLTYQTALPYLFAVTAVKAVGKNRIGKLIVNAGPSTAWFYFNPAEIAIFPRPFLTIADYGSVLQMWYYFDSSGSDHGRIVSNTSQSYGGTGRCLELQPSPDTVASHHILPYFAVTRVKTGAGKALKVMAKHDGNDRVELQGSVTVDGIQAVAWTTFNLSSSYQEFALNVPGGSVLKDTLAVMHLRFRLKNPTYTGVAYVDEFSSL